ncbi:MAG: VirB4 family type IV secretion/conjugal transfer ATPase [Gammaproteobacteria bacterium]
MSHSNRINAVRSETGVSNHFPVTHLNDPTIFETENGMVAMVLRFDGIVSDAKRNEVLNQQKFILHRAITLLDDRFSVMVNIHRHRKSTVLKGKFENTFSRILNQQYHSQFIKKSMYVNDIYMVVMYKGLSSGKMGKGLRVFQKMKHKAVKTSREVTRQSQIKSLKERVEQIRTLLSSFKPILLGEHDQKLGYSEILHYLSLPVNGGEPLRMPYASYTMPIGRTLQSAKKSIQLYPHGKISQFLTNKQIFFGEYIQFQGPTKKDVTFGAMLSIKQYGTESANVMFDKLLHCNCEFIATHTFSVEAKDVALGFMSKHIRRMQNVNDPAASQIESLHEARDLLGGDRLSMGYHHHTVMLLEKSVAALESAISECVKVYADVGFVAVRETLGQEPAFWAQIPGNFKHIARASLITSENFVDFSPLHNYPIGFYDANHLGSAVTLLETPSKTPYYFNFHVRGSRENPSKGHAILIGGNGSGKTAMMTFMDAQLGRYGGNTFYFDRDRGAEIYIRASSGIYAILSPNFPEDTQFSPLQLPDTPANRQFNRDLLVQFCKESESEELNAEIINQLTECIHYAYDHLASEHRTFSHATRILPMNFSKWPNLRRWLKGDEKHHDGEYAYIFDNSEDHLALHSKMGFDMTHFLDHEPAHVRTAVMMYLFHRIDLAIEGKANNASGRLTTVMLDEGWQYFIDAYWKEKLKRVLPTWRKRNAHLVMGTQSPSSVVQSPLRSIIMDNVATQIYFTNPQATREDYINGLRLSDSEYDIIQKNSPESRVFLLKQEHDSVVCRLNLGHLSDLLAVLSGNTASVQLLDRIRKEFGDNPEEWLPIFHQRRKELI